MQPPSRSRLRHHASSSAPIPFDLNGEAEIHFDLLGVHAHFAIPSNFVQVLTGPGSSAVQTETLTAAPQLSGTALIVEDNLIIAMSAEVILLELGARHVETAASVAEALRAIERQKPDFALLDLNLGPENSLAVGRHLIALKVPFIFATGYGERAPIPEELVGARRSSRSRTRATSSSARCPA